MELGLTGKKIVISGAASGIGSVTFQRALEEGAYPIGIDILSLRGSELETRLRQGVIREKSYKFYQRDAGDRAEISEALRDAERIDGLVNNCVLVGNDTALGGRTEEVWSRAMHHNAQTAYTLTEIVHPKMIDGGSIVNIGSILLTMSSPGKVLYTTAKGALYGMMVGYTTTLGPRGIRINMISPGNVSTESNKRELKDDKPLIEGFEARTPIGRSVEPEEVANLALFLLSDQAKAITGQEILIDGGYSRALWDPMWTGITRQEMAED